MSDGMQLEQTEEVAAEGTATQPLSKKALVSAVLGVLGLSGFLFAAAIIAIVLGNSAKREIETTGKRGKGVAIMGIVLGWMGIAVAFFLLSLLLLTDGVTVVD
jgi:hypothetical protein